MVSFNILFTLSIGIIFLLRKTSESLFANRFVSLVSILLSMAFLSFLGNSLNVLHSKPAKNVGSYLSCFDLKILKKMNVGSVPIGIPKDLNSFLIFLHSSSGITLSSYIRGVNIWKLCPLKDEICVLLFWKYSTNSESIEEKNAIMNFDSSGFNWFSLITFTTSSIHCSVGCCIWNIFIYLFLLSIFTFHKWVTDNS